MGKTTAVADRLDTILDRVNELALEAGEKYDELSEKAQESERGEKLSALRYACDDAAESIEAAIERLREVE